MKNYRSIEKLASIILLLFLLPLLGHSFSTISTISKQKNIIKQAPILSSSSIVLHVTKSEEKVNIDVEEEETDEDVIKMKHDIEQMKLEAMERIQHLSTKMKDLDISTSITTPSSSSVKSKQHHISQKLSESKGHKHISNNDKSTSLLDNEASITESLFKKRIEREIKSNTDNKDADLSMTNAKSAELHHKDDLELLDETHWKVALNIGREKGTWMPKDWGISGERLLVNLEICFSSQQSYEREDFLGSVGNAKICRVIDQECIVGPTLSEGSRKFEVKDGGYRICKEGGPLKTDLLRFYFDVQEVIQHTGSDVYCPKGRVYCTCGFFPENKGTGSLKKLHIRRKIEDLERDIVSLEERIKDDNSNFITKMSLMKQAFQLSNIDKPNLEKKLLEAQVTEPDTALLKFSRKRDVALTKEGGICCKVKKEAGRYEYHILGKFGLGAVDAREGHE